MGLMLQDKAISREALNSDGTFLDLQRWIIEALKERFDILGGGKPVVSDRSVVDALGYTAWRFGDDSPEVRRSGRAKNTRILPCSALLILSGPAVYV